MGYIWHLINLYLANVIHPAPPLAALAMCLMPGALLKEVVLGERNYHVAHPFGITEILLKDLGRRKAKEAEEQ